MNGGDVMAEYGRWPPASVQCQAESSAARGRRSYVHLARPGILGSTGNHLHRRRLREVAPVNAALSKPGDTLGWKQVHLVRHSGGAHLVAALMTRRNDIGCAVIAAGALAVKLRNKRLRLDKDETIDATGYSDFLPIDEVGAVPLASPRTIIIASGRHDLNVTLEEQAAYVDALKVHRQDVRHETIESGEASIAHFIQEKAHAIAFKAAAELD